MTGLRQSLRRDPWLPAAVALVGVVTSLLAWSWLVADRRDQLVARTEAIAEEIAEATRLGLEQQVEHLVGLTAIWSAFGLPSASQWRSDVAHRIEQTPALESIAIASTDPGLDRIESAATPDAAVDGRADLAVAHQRLDAGRIPPTAEIEGPIPNANDRPGYRTLLPIRLPDGRAAILVARYDAGLFLEDVLRGRARGYASVVRWGEELIHARDTPSPDRWQAWWDVERSVALPWIGDWTLRLRPTAALAAARLTPVPHYLLAAGLLLSLALAVLVHQLRVTVRQSRTLAASNRALEHRGLELESRVAERTAALEDAIDELEAFNYSVSHDLRSPLGAILNFTTILAEDYDGKPLDEEGRGILERIRRSALRATALLEDLLRLSRAGRAAISKDRIDMTALAREAFGQARAADGADDVELVVGPLPEAVGDRTLLADVLANLFGNALKYSRDTEKRRIEVSGRIEGREAIYVVADNGQGFDMRYVDKLFRLFERLHGDEGIEGTGVGLAMVRRIVKRHGGRVWAEGEPGVGARFSFSLPREETG